MSYASIIANQPNRRRLRKDSRCPCNSNLKYGDCCLARGIHYYRDNEGTIVRVLEIPSELTEAAVGLMESYEDIFFRKAVADDPMFLEILLTSDEEREEKSAEIFKYAFNTPEEDLYACRKLGFLISKANKKYASQKDIDQWEKAKKEYFDITNGKIKIEEDVNQILQDELENWNVRLIYLYALILYKLEEEVESVLNFNDKTDINAYVLFCLTKNLKTLKAITALTRRNFNEDGLSLFRSIYENYLQITTSVHNPEQLKAELTAKIGLQVGTHKMGKGNEIIHIKDGTITVPLNNKQKAALDKEFNHENMIIYRNLYEYLSWFVHPDIRVAGHYWREGYFSHNTKANAFLLYYYVNYINVLMLFELLRIPMFQGQNRLDIKSFIRRISTLLLFTIKGVKEKEDSFPELKSRLLKIIKHPLLKQ